MNRTAMASGAVKLVPPVVLFLLVVAAWEIVIDVYDVPKFILASPSAVARAARKHHGELQAGLAFTAARVSFHATS